MFKVSYEFLKSQRKRSIENGFFQIIGTFFKASVRLFDPEVIVGWQLAPQGSRNRGHGYQSYQDLPL